MSPSPFHLSNVSLHGFRGIERDLELAFGRKLTIVFGGNATGKSSVTQALEFVLSGQISDFDAGRIPSEYLSHAHATSPGSVKVSFTNGKDISASTDQSRSSVDAGFRALDAVDWPERQVLPIATTHITTQGMLARVLGTAAPVTRNDLSALCSGSHLRFLVTRAQKLTDHFRQASSGRNIQSALRDAIAKYNTALLLRQALTTSEQPSFSQASLEARKAELCHTAGLPEDSTLETLAASLQFKREGLDRHLRTLQSLLDRTRELGQNEAELTALQEQARLLEAQLSELESARHADAAAIDSLAEQMRAFDAQRITALDVLSKHELQQQALAAAAALEARLVEVRSSHNRAKDRLATIDAALTDARDEFARRSAAQLDATTEKTVVDGRLAVLERVFGALTSLHSVDAAEFDSRIAAHESELAALDTKREAVQLSLSASRDREATLFAKLDDAGKREEHLQTALLAIRTAATDSHCPLCGHDHDTVAALITAANALADSRHSDADHLRVEYDAAVRARMSYESHLSHCSASIAAAESQLRQLKQARDKRSGEQRQIRAELGQQLKDAGCDFALSADALVHSIQDLMAGRPLMDEAVRRAADGVRTVEQRRNELERELATTSAEAGQLSRLASELQGLSEAAKERTTPTVSPDAISAARAQLANLDSAAKAMERELGQLQATRSERDRSIASSTAELAGVTRRREAVAGLLRMLDTELDRAGVSRDPETVLNAERAARQDRENVLLALERTSEVTQQQKILDDQRMFVTADEQVRATQAEVGLLQERQRDMEAKSILYSTLHGDLARLQESAAEIVLNSIKAPVKVIFQAMTAGCPWDIEFKLEDGTVSAVLTDGGTKDLVATSVLNSAYLNVAAIALRIALAGQQRWTSLKTVVLDDPILEMDHLTQSALIDGLEALLLSTEAPWKDLQFVLTTWSEDFAVMAAHKLAHLNGSPSTSGDQGPVSSRDNFVIHRLGRDPHGTIGAVVHVPRWRPQLKVA